MGTHNLKRTLKQASHQDVFSRANLKLGTFPTLRTIIFSRLFPVKTFTALLDAILSNATAFTSSILSPTSRPPCSVKEKKDLKGQELCKEEHLKMYVKMKT